MAAPSPTHAPKGTSMETNWSRRPVVGAASMCGGALRWGWRRVGSRGWSGDYGGNPLGTNGPDRVRWRRARRELRQRAHRLPGWLTPLTPPRVTRVMATTHHLAISL